MKNVQFDKKEKSSTELTLGSVIYVQRRELLHTSNT